MRPSALHDKFVPAVTLAAGLMTLVRLLHHVRSGRRFDLHCSAATIFPGDSSALRTVLPWFLLIMPLWCPSITE